MTAFQICTLALLTAGILILAAAVWLDWRHNNAITQRNQAVEDAANMRADIDKATNALSAAVDQHETTKREMEEALFVQKINSSRELGATEVLLEEYRQVRHLLGTYAPHDPGADQ